VLVDNYAPGGLGRLGFPWEELHRINPGLIYATSTGFGYTGPYKDYPAYDMIAQAYAGVMDITGWPGGPPTKTGPAITDFGNPLHLTVGVLAALRYRDKTGRGQWVDCAQFDCATWFAVLEQFNEYMVTGKESPVMGRQGNRHPLIAPYNCYEAKDGWAIIAVADDTQWVRFCKAMGKPELLDKPEFKTPIDRRKTCDDVDGIVSEWVKTKTADEVIEILNKADVPVGKVQSILDLPDDAQIKARDMWVEVEETGVGKVKFLGSPIKMSETPGCVEWGGKPIGYDNKEVLGELGYGEDAIAKLKEEGTI
jgi:crotonobetainyl-CoA:carnitine CoA-transferase CaiB-like acyl-CoA transferase